MIIMSDTNEAGTRRDDALIKAKFVMISAGRDNERSAGIATVDKDFSLPISPAGKSGGVFTCAFLQVLNELVPQEEVSWMHLMERLRAIVKERGFLNQVPQLSSSIQLNINDPFVIVPPSDGNVKKRRQRAIMIGTFILLVKYKC
jgi:hypothetical protein